MKTTKKKNIASIVRMQPLQGTSANTPLAELERAYMRLSLLMFGKCGPACGRPGPLCTPEHCASTARYAREVHHVQLTRRKHPTLPFRGEYGCTAAPHLRPTCTVYVCEKHLAEDPTFAAYYRDLRDEIAKLETRLRSLGVLPMDVPVSEVRPRQLPVLQE